MRLRHWLFLCCAGLTLTGVSPAASARADSIGRVAVATNMVKELAPAASLIGVGAEVIRDELVQTGAESNARVVFVDDTNLSMGPGATIRMDASVYSGGAVRAVAAKLTVGAFRFVTGNGPKQDYSIQTQLATIGVRGTILDILAQRGREVIVLREGAAVACIKTTGKCINLNHDLDTLVIVVVNGNVRVTTTRRPPWTFAAMCQTNSALCAAARYAQTEPAVPGPSDALCGR